VLPETPVMKEAGVDGLVVYSWQAVAAPKGLPDEVKAKLQPALVASLKDPAVTKRLDDIGFAVVAGTSAEFAAFLDEEYARWRNVVETGNIKAED
jgi:tripartite-type tricarboxylate transporter receptor subunit TctC